MEFSFVDITVFLIYLVVIVSIGLWVSREKKGHEKNTEDYFLAGKSLPWWAIGASLIAANISAEQFIGMSGSGFAIGLAIASYEWMSALTLIVVAKYFMPIFIEKKLYTIPEFIEVRYNKNLKTILAIFWIALFIFVNLTSVLFLGAKAVDTIIGNGDGSLIVYAVIGLGLIAIAYSLYGGLSAVAWTDVVQVIMLVFGGLIATLFALNYVTPEGGIINGINHIYQAAGDKFQMILSRNNPEYFNLPGIAVLIGGMWVANLYYWGFNQYIIQRALAAKSIKEAQRGLAFAGFLKLIIPLIVVIPGIIAFVMYTQPEGTTVIPGVQEAFTRINGSINYDKAYPWLIRVFVPTGLKGIVIAALVAAIVSSLASMLNSTSTIFTMDIYKNYINREASEKRMVNIGRLTSVGALLIAGFLAPLMGNIPQMFQYIQEYTGLVSPGILAVFLMGLFWKKSTSKAAIAGILISIPLALLLKLPAVELPWMDQMLYTMLLTMVVIAGISMTTSPDVDDPKGISLTRETFKTDPVFNMSAYAIMIILVMLYAVFW